MLKSKIAAFVLLLALAAPLRAEASWTRPPKQKPVTALQGFQNSANGLVTNLMPWNWLGKRSRQS